MLPNGGPAFPTDTGRQTGQDTYHYEGMTLRDYFAAHALTGILAAAQSHGYDEQVVFGFSESRQAYTMADAMVARRAELEGESV